MNVLTYRNLLQNNEKELVKLIDNMSDLEKITLRGHLERLNIAALRSLYYDYKEQRWID